MRAGEPEAAFACAVAAPSAPHACGAPPPKGGGLGVVVEVAELVAGEVEGVDRVEQSVVGGAAWIGR